MSSNKTAQVQAQVNETIGVMQNNIAKVMERGERLEDLNQRSENLAQASSDFRTSSKEVRMKMFWQDKKTKMILAAILLVVVGLIIGVSVWATGVHNTPVSGGGSPRPST
ncbi:Vesicle-associated membrane protein 4 [Podochytrium sp. JEL0797]|nr:Vesicle-associated membrane protein 4 [Podochytrium sp. JEL0797]